MTQFDILLRRALMDANLAQYESVLRQAAQTDHSPGYVQERTRLLADPWGWGRSRSPGGRLNWRLIALIAALLLLSACAAAVVTGQFSQWFPSRGVNYQAPEESEEVLGRTGTLIEQTRTEGEATVTLNAASWDGETLLLSLVLKSPEVPGLPEDYTPGPTGPYGNGLHTAECYLSLREDQWLEYERAQFGSNFNEAEAREGRGLGLRKKFPFFQLLSREDDTLTFEISVPLYNYVERPEITFHLENLSFYQHEGFHIHGPFDFTFTLEKTIPAIRYKCGGVEVTLQSPARWEIPMRFTEFQLSTTEMMTTCEVLTRVAMPWDEEDPDKLPYMEISFALWKTPWGLWMEDGAYMDLTGRVGVISGGAPGRSLSLDTTSSFPYPIDPAAVTALNIGGVRVELSELERTTEPVS